LYAWIESLVSRVRGWTRKGGGHAASDDIDTELRDVFLAEMTDVLQSIDAALTRWRVNPSDTDAHKQLRRGFHTIKGSAPLVRAELLGAYCKDLERLMNEFQERPAKVTPIAISTLAQAISLLPAFGDSLRANRPAPALASNVHQRVLRLIAR
jgi:chemosensory pili system protein ChpA (sensor histidine kinase/response regulator)